MSQEQDTEGHVPVKRNSVEPADEGDNTEGHEEVGGDDTDGHGWRPLRTRR